MAARGKGWLAVALLLVAGAACALWLWSMRGGGSRSEGQKPRGQSASTPRVHVPRLEEIPYERRAQRPPPARGGYVGSERCASCHAEIAAEWATHPMSRSLQPVPSASPIEDYEHHAQFRTSGGREYRVELRDGAVWHYEALLDAAGNMVYEQGYPVRFAIGSGTRGCTYAIDLGGILVASPISWYTGRQAWDLSPGYLPGHHPRFGRRVPETCLWCHGGLVAARPGRFDQFQEPPLQELTMGCERCHGPGAEHVAAREAGQALSKPDPTIVNPLHLAPRQRESICNHCHLQGKVVVPRYGRSMGDFRPGEVLDDTLTVFVHRQTVREDGLAKAVSQVAQMQLSLCYQHSDGRLGCISCHAGHAKPPEESKLAYYRQKCLACHAEQDCSAPQAQQAQQGHACTECHMPRLGLFDVAHASQTDHRILRHPSAAPAPVETPTQFGELVPFAGSEQYLQPWELDRARGIALISLAHEDPLPDRRALRQGIKLLDTSLRKAPDDLPALHHLGIAYLSLHEPKAAREYLAAALELAPEHEKLLAATAQAYRELGARRTALRYARRALQVNPWNTGLHMLECELLAELEQWEACRRATLRGLKVDPANTALRALLIEACRAVGRTQAAHEQHELLERIQAAALLHHADSTQGEK